MSKEKSSPVKTLFGFLAGVISGATLGLLLAPKSGKETREELKTKGEELFVVSKEDLAKKTKELKIKVDEVTKDLEKGIEKLKPHEKKEAEPKEGEGGEKKQEAKPKKGSAKK